MEMIKCDIITDWKNSDISYVTSPFLSHDIPYICDQLSPNSIVWCVNDPRFTVNSFDNKGWYSYDSVRGNDNYYIGIQPWNKVNLNRSFARIIPNDEFYNTWKNLKVIFDYGMMKGYN